MNGFPNPIMNPYGIMPNYQPQIPMANQSQVVRVNGENGARAYQIGANSSALLLDESGLMVWLVTSDGAGYKTVSAYDIAPHKEAPAPDYESLENRIKRLEEMINGNSGNTSAARKIKPDDAADQKNDRYGKRFTESAGGYQSDDYE